MSDFDRIEAAREPGSTVYVEGLPFTVVRYSERDGKYVLQSQDGFNTRRWYTLEEVEDRQDTVRALYHVPRSQVWEGSRGRQSGNVHLHVDGRALCGRHGWYEREAYPSEEPCPRCYAIAERRDIPWPTSTA